MMRTKGIIMAAGTGSRLWPLTQAISKQLMPVFDKPMIYYPLNLLMQAGVRDIAIITNPEDQDAFEKLLGGGAQWGINLTYIQQEQPNGIGVAPILAEKFLGGSPFVLALGDNLFHGKDLVSKLSDVIRSPQGATLFSTTVNDPRAFGVASYGADGSVLDLCEKPETPKSDQAITGLYVFDNRAVSWAPWLRPSQRGEIEITDLLRLYHKNDALKGRRLQGDITWLDTGTQTNLLAAANFVESRQLQFGEIIGSPDATAFENSWIDFPRFVRLALQHQKTDYGASLMRRLGANQRKFASVSAG